MNSCPAPDVESKTQQKYHRDQDRNHCVPECNYLQALRLNHCFRRSNLTAYRTTRRQRITSSFNQNMWLLYSKNTICRQLLHSEFVRIQHLRNLYVQQKPDNTIAIHFCCDHAASKIWKSNYGSPNHTASKAIPTRWANGDTAHDTIWYMVKQAST